MLLKHNDKNCKLLKNLTEDAEVDMIIEKKPW